MIAAVDAVGIGAALVLLRVPLALPLALITFLGGFIPIIGATVAGAVAVLVALAARGPPSPCWCWPPSSPCSRSRATCWSR